MGVLAVGSRTHKSTGDGPLSQSLVHDRRAIDLPSGVPVRFIEVADPFEHGAKIMVAQSMRDDPLGRLHCRGQIDDAQYHAGRDMQGFYERATIGGLKAMDTTKEPVDGGGFPEALTEKIQEAVAEINRLERVLGIIDAAIVRDVLAKGMFLREVARARDQDSQLGFRYIARRFRNALELLAVEMGYAARPRG